jgi:hypothetical protein
MAYRSLREFMARLESQGELVRVREPVSTVLEMTEIQTRLLATGGPAVLFENPVRADGERSSIPCLANLFGTVRRVAMGVTLQGKERTTARDLREVGELLAFLRQPEPPRGFREAFDMLPLARTVMSMRPNVVRRGPVQDVVLQGADIDLTKAADPDLLAGRARAADHLAAGGHQGAGQGARGRLQPRHLPDAGAGARPHHHALAGAPRAGPSTTPGTSAPRASRSPPRWCWGRTRAPSWRR